MNKKNILIATQAMGIGGCETYIVTICEELIKRDYNICIVAGDGRLRAVFENIGVKPYIIDFFDRSLAIRNIEKIKEIIINEKIDYVFVNPFYPIFEAICASVLSNVPYYLFLHGVSIEGIFDINDAFSVLGRWYSMYINDIAFKYAKKCVYVSDEAKEFYQKKFDVDEKHGILLKNSVKIIDNGDFPTKLEKFILVSRIDIDKINSIKIGIDFYIKLWNNSYNKENLVLDIVGEGQCIEELKAYIKDYGQYNINIVGATNNPYATIKKYDALLGMGRTILEAISLQKLPIIITYNKYIGVLEPSMLPDISYANYSGRNAESKDKQKDIDMILNMDIDNLQTLLQQNLEYVYKNNNITINIEEILNDMQQEYALYNKSTLEEIKQYISLVEYITNMEITCKKLQEQNNMDMNNKNQEIEKLNEKVQSHQKIQIENNILREKIRDEQYNSQVLEQEISNNEDTIKKYEEEIEYYKKLLNDIYSKKTYKVYKKFKKILGKK